MNSWEFPRPKKRMTDNIPIDKTGLICRFNSWEMCQRLNDEEEDEKDHHPSKIAVRHWVMNEGIDWINWSNSKKQECVWEASGGALWDWGLGSPSPNPRFHSESTSCSRHRSVHRKDSHVLVLSQWSVSKRLPVISALCFTNWQERSRCPPTLVPSALPCNFPLPFCSLSGEGELSGNQECPCCLARGQTRAGSLSL